MAFQLRLGTSPGPIPGRLQIELRSAHFNDTVQFPPPGTIIVRDYSVPSGVRFEMHADFYVNQDRVGLTITRLGSDDVLSVLASPHNAPSMPRPGALYLGTVWHSTAQNEHCTVTCDDGSTDECCATCSNGQSVTKICC
jgi:hypothetical protein